MDSSEKPKVISCFLSLSIFCLLTIFVEPQHFDSLTQKVTFYPASLMVSYNPKPLTFYDDTKLLNMHTVLNFTNLGKRFMMSNHSCSLFKSHFFEQLLETVRRFQKVARRLLSLPGFSTLVECDTYLPRYVQFLVGQPSRMSCPRAYRNSISECKVWALRFCRGYSVDERQWLQSKQRHRRSNWMCHAGALGLFRAIYTGTGHKCEPNHVANLKETLRSMVGAMFLTQTLIRIVNGKVVYLFKITDQMNSKINVLAEDLKRVDATFIDWQRQLNTFSNSVKCQEGLTMEFLSKYSAEVNRAFAAFLRLLEIQDTLNQVSRLNGKTLVGYSDLPKFISSHLSSKLVLDPSLGLTITALEQGLSVLASPMVDVEHDGKDLGINILVLGPEIADQNNFCVVEHLSPLKFNLSGNCFTGPVRQTNLALITYPNSKQVVSIEALDKCFSSEVGFLCPKHVLKTISSLHWLGFAWNPELKLSFARNHQSAPNCDHLQPLIHLGGRRFLSTTSGSIPTTDGNLDVSPLAVYSFPCNTSFVGLKTTLASCPESLSISLPLFSASSITNVHWNPASDDVSPLELHHKSLTIPPSLTINKTAVNDLDELYQFYDSQLSSALKKTEAMIDQIEVTSETTLTEYIAFVACALSVIDFVLFCVACKCILRAVNRRFTELPQQSFPLRATPVPSSSTKVCKQCSKPVRNHQLKDRRPVPHKQEDLQITKQ